jgi:peptidoglycan hydrolase-like protein with peptidoglycan-binding domain
MEQGVRRFARLKPDAAKADAAGDTLPDAPEAEGDPETIRAVQRELTARNYGPLVPDGVPGLVTRAAIMAFEHDNRLPLTGEATEKLLARILLGASGGQTGNTEPAAGRVRSSQAEIVMRTVQSSLVALGYQVGRVDGRTGEDTERAIREFELDEGLKPTGRVSAEVFSRLGRVVASAKPQPVR